VATAPRGAGGVGLAIKRTLAREGTATAVSGRAPRLHVIHSRP
jgi:hypothetical protein